jgi:cytochrome c biogenesis protein CcmG, thiol:disulfide interchange protein DsbE
MKFAVPLLLFAMVAAFLGVGLERDPRYVASPLIGKPAPRFELPQLHDPAKTTGSNDMLGKVWVMNVWASWCVSCRAEHQVLTALARGGLAPVHGLDYKDEPEGALSFLRTYGNPYAVVGQDRDGRIGIDYGVYGVPETYVIDRDGVIRYKQVGAISAELLERTIVPLLTELNR